MAIDLYNNQVAKHPTRARKLMNSVNQQEANEKFRAAINMLGKNDRKVAVLGRSYGANQAIHAASVNSQRISAVVLYYPFGDISSMKNSLATISAPVLGNFALNDIFFDKGRQQKFVTTAINKGIKLKVENYSARHGFTNILSDHFNTEAEKSSSNKTFSFLAQHLR